MKKLKFLFILFTFFTFYTYAQQVHPNSVIIKNVTPGTKADSVVVIDNTGLLHYLSRTNFLSNIGGESPLTFQLPLLRTGDDVTISQAGLATNGYLSSANFTNFNTAYNWGNHAIAGYETQMARRIYPLTGTYTPVQGDVGTKAVLTTSSSVILEGDGLTAGYQQVFVNNTGGSITFTLPTGNTSLSVPVALENSQPAYIHLMSVGATNIWEVIIGGQTGGVGSTTLSGLTDTAISAPVPNQALTWNGTHWVNTTLSGGVTQLNDLTDVSEVSYTNRWALMANGAGQYVSRALVQADISDLTPHLNESQVDAFVANNGYLTSYTETQTATTVPYNNTTANMSPAVTHVQGAIDNLDGRVDALSAGASLDLDGLTDVDLAVPVNGEVLKFNGTLWVDATDRVLTEGEVDGFVSNNGYLTSYTETQNASQVNLSTAIPNLTAMNVQNALAELQGDVTTLSSGTAATNLNTTTSTTTVTINSDTGNDATISSASGTAAGILTTALYNNIIANNAKVTNATHTGDVTGSGLLSIASDVIVPTDLKVDSGTGDATKFLKYSSATGFSWAVPTDLNTIYTHPNHIGEVTSIGDGAQTLGITAITNRADIGSALVGTDEFLVNDGGTLKKSAISRIADYTNAGVARLASSNIFTESNTFPQILVKQFFLVGGLGAGDGNFTVANSANTQSVGFYPTQLSVTNPFTLTGNDFYYNRTIAQINAAVSDYSLVTREWVLDRISLSGGGTVTSVSGAGTVNGLTLSGTVTTAGSLSLTGSVVVGSSNITDNSIAAVDIATGGVGTDEILNGTIKAEDLLNAVAPTSGQIPTFNSTTGGFTWVAGTSGTLTGLTAGSGINIVATNPAAPTINANLGATVESSEIVDGTITPWDMNITGDGVATNLYLMRYNFNGGNAFFDLTPNMVGTVTSVEAGAGMTLSGTNTINPTLDVIGGSGITVNANNIQLGALSADWAAGTFAITAGSFYETSLKALKVNINPFIKSGLDIIRGLQIVEYDKVDGPANKIGVIIDDSPVEIANEDHTAVDLYKTIFVQAKAIQELDKKVQSLEERIAKLEALHSSTEEILLNLERLKNE